MLTLIYNCLYRIKSYNNLYKVFYKISKLLINIFLPIYYKITGFHSGVNLKSEKNIIVSLTTFPARIDKVSICIESLMRQTIKPNRIILWLAKDQFESTDVLPKSLLLLRKRGLDIRFCEDLRSFKKFYYTMKEYPNSIVITVDDDMFYPETLIEDLYNAHKRHPHTICCNIAHLMTLNEQKQLNAYDMWIGGAKNIQGPSHLLCPIGVGGILYPPHLLIEEVFNKSVFMDICPKADDLWLKSIEYLSGIGAVKVRKQSPAFIDILGSQKESLNKTNVNNCENDIQMKNIIDKYKIYFEQ